MLCDVGDGALCVLEHAYLTRVERAHRLPRGRRQKPDPGEGGSVYRDVEYEEFALVVELDGRLWHQGFRRRNKDMERDLGATLLGRQSIRVGWAQSVETPCRTAGKIGQLLQLRGWAGHSQPCCPKCPIRSAG